MSRASQPVVQKLILAPRLSTAALDNIPENLLVNRPVPLMPGPVTI
jgi:hypothetical protein